MSINQKITKNFKHLKNEIRRSLIELALQMTEETKVGNEADETENDEAKGY